MVDQRGQFLGRQFGNYRLIKLLGEGGFAEVYLGEHIHLGTHAAVKVLSTKLADDEIAQFRNEARTIFGLEHSNIVRILEFGMEGLIPFIIMNYAPNGSLRKCHPKGIRLPPEIIVTYVKQIASALQYAHDKGLVHRDIKPDNMLVGRNQEILLSDFGIALISQSSSYLSTKDVAGTIAYMAPEQIQAHPRPASDQYSLAVVIYEWLSGNRPFHGTYTEIAIKHISAPPPLLCERFPDIPVDVEKVVFTALAKDPSQRFTSVQAFSNALEQAFKKPSIGTTRLTYYGHSDTVYTIAWSPHNKHIASAGLGNTVNVWDTGGNTIWSYLVQTASVNRILWSPNGQLLACGTSSGIVYVLDVVTKSEVLIDGDHYHNVVDLVWSADSKHISSVSHDSAQVWNVRNGKCIYTYPLNDDPDCIGIMSWSPDSKHIAYDDWFGSVIYVIDISSKSNIPKFSLPYENLLLTLTSPPAMNHDDIDDSLPYENPLLTLTWSPNGMLFAFSTNEIIHILDVITETIYRTYSGHTNQVITLAWSPDSKKIASADNRGSIQVWDITTGNHIYTSQSHSTGVLAIAWSPDCACIASASHDQVQVWQTV